MLVYQRVYGYVVMYGNVDNYPTKLAAHMATPLLLTTIEIEKKIASVSHGKGASRG